MRLRKRALAVGAALTVVGVVAAWTVSANAAPAPAAKAPNTPAAALRLAIDHASAQVAGKPAFLHATANDSFVQSAAVSSSGLNYVAFGRTYKDLKVVGGDFVLVANNSGEIVAHSVAQEYAIGDLSIVPALSRGNAESIAKGQLKTVNQVEGTQLVVHALGDAPRLAWESTVNGTGAEGYSRLTVDVDAITGDVLGTQEHVLNGTGNSGWNGSNVHIDTTLTGSTFSMLTPSFNNMPCQDAANNTTFTGPDDLWGNGNATNRETGCVDSLYGAQGEIRMLSQWLGRTGMDGNNGAWPIRVGLAQVNAFYDGTQVQVGHNNAGQWIGSIDVITHEMGHGIDDHTPGGISGKGTQEFIADAFGAASEAFIRGQSDYLVGAEINLVGSGPIRNMFNPSLLGDPNCYSRKIQRTEVHAAAGPGNHWFYLLAEGTSGPDNSPTCNNSTFAGVGIQNAIKILYNAMLMKTSQSSYPMYRVWTLTAAKNMTPGNCTLFNATKAAWNAISVPAQSGEPTC
jgi:Zn-dependent metalloprotease